MNISIHTDRVERRLSSVRGVVAIDHLEVEQVGTENVARIQARLEFWDGSLLDLSELVDSRNCRFPRYQIYSYNYRNCEGEVEFRYDNAHEYPDLPTSPSHKHVRRGGELRAVAADRPTYDELLDEVQRSILARSGDGAGPN